MSTLFIGGLPPSIEEIEIAKLIMPFGQINTIKIVRDKLSGRSKGFAFVEMQQDLEAEEASIQLDGEVWHENKLTVKIQTERLAKTAKPYLQSKPYGNTKYIKIEHGQNAGKQRRPRRETN
jgi:RNA recognition motif-containing protein